MGRAFEYRKAAKLKRWGHMANTFTRLGEGRWSGAGKQPDTAFGYRYL